MTQAQRTSRPTPPLQTKGVHLLAEYFGCSAAMLDDAALVERVMVEAARHAGSTIVDKAIAAFSPQGVTGILLLAESHLSVHTWPEHSYAAVDFFACGASDPLLAHSVISEGLLATDSELLIIDRGCGHLCARRYARDAMYQQTDGLPSRRSLLLERLRATETETRADTMRG